MVAVFSHYLREHVDINEHCETFTDM